MPRSDSRSRTPPRGRGLPYDRPPLRRRRAATSAAASSSSVTSRYPVDERCPSSPVSRADCESSVASELSVGSPIDWIGPESAAQFTPMLGATGNQVTWMNVQPPHLFCLPPPQACQRMQLLVDCNQQCSPRCHPLRRRQPLTKAAPCISGMLVAPALCPILRWVE